MHLGTIIFDCLFIGMFFLCDKVQWLVISDSFIKINIINGDEKILKFLVIGKNKNME